MEKHKCDKNVYGRQCDESFPSESQLKNHISNYHKVIVIDKNPEPVIKPVLNVWSGEMVTHDPFKIEPRKIKSSDQCVHCGRPAYIFEPKGKPICYGWWSTWGCTYHKYMIDYDRKWFKIPIRYRISYDARPLSKKERKKTIKYVMTLEYEIWNACSRTPQKELETWHDDKLRREIRCLEVLKAGQC